MRPIPDGTKFPAKTNGYGRKTRYEIATSARNGVTAFIQPGDQRMRGGVQWAYDTREAAQKVCAAMNEARASMLVNKGSTVAQPPPAFYENQTQALFQAGEYLACAIAFELARSASIGHTRRNRYEASAKYYRSLDARRYAEAYPS